MTRTKLITGIGSALGAMVLFASAAQACISCNYVPEVLNASKESSSHSYRAERSFEVSAAMREQLARAQMAKAQMARAQIAKAQMAKAMAAKARAAATRKIETASITQKEEVDVAQPAVSAKSETSSGSKREKPVSTATLLVRESVTAPEAEAAKPTECKKFIAAIGTTVTVPCK